MRRRLSALDGCWPRWAVAADGVVHAAMVCCGAPACDAAGLGRRVPKWAQAMGQGDAFTQCRVVLSARCARVLAGACSTGPVVARGLQPSGGFVLCSVD